MVPFQAIMLPIYIITLKLNLVDSYGNLNGYLGLILPFAVKCIWYFPFKTGIFSCAKGA